MLAIRSVILTYVAYVFT